MGKQEDGSLFDLIGFHADAILNYCWNLEKNLDDGYSKRNHIPNKSLDPQLRRRDGVRRCVLQLKEAQSAIPELIRVIEKCLPILESLSTTLSVRNAFRVLPDDVVALIFEHACDADQSTAVSLSCVSKRFRRISLSLPALWTELSSKDSIGTNRLRCSRTHSIGFGVHLWCRQDPNDKQRHPIGADRVRKLFSFSLSQSSHLRHLHFYLNPTLWCTAKLLERLHTAYRVVSLPALETLSLQVVGAKEEDPIFHFYREWDLPSLRRIEAATIVPELRPEVCARLTSCKLVFRTADTSAWSYRTSLFAFLDTLADVQELDLHLDRNGMHFNLPRPNNSTTNSKDGYKLSLPHLTSLSLFTGRHCDYIGRTFLSALLPCPKLTRLTLETSLSYFQSSQDWLRFLGPFGYSNYKSYDDFTKGRVRESSFPALEDLTIHFHDQYISPDSGLSGRSLTFDDAFEQLRHLKHLTLRGNRFRQILHWSDRFPRLHSLRLEDIDYLDTDLVGYVADAAQRGGHNFGSIRLKNCTMAYGRSPLSMAADEKLIWA